MGQLLIVALVAMLGVVGNAPAASAVDGAWEADANIGAVVPYSKYRKSVKGNVGGSVGFAGGYRFLLRDDVALSLLAQPQFTVMPTEQERSVSGDNETASMFIGTGGPKLTLLGDPIETWFSAQGGWYHDMTGPIGDEGPGWNAGMGVNYRITPATSVGLYGNYHWADIDASVEHSGPRRFIVSGFNVVHAYLAPEPVETVPPPPPPPPLPAPKKKIILRGVNFDFDKATIRPDAESILAEATRTLQDEGEIQISVEGHTDSVGTEAYNQGLSERRAHAVADHLAGGGISRGRMTARGFGESNPVASNMNRDGRAQNRRVELKIVD